MKHTAEVELAKPTRVEQDLENVLKNCLNLATHQTEMLELQVCQLIAMLPNTVEIEFNS